MKLEIINYKYYDGSQRPLYILRPNNFEKDKLYKTIYFFDGNSTFVASEYTDENWGVKEALEKLNINDCIAIGLEHAGENRIAEYLPYDISYEDKKIKSRKEQFDPFFIKEIIPYIEKNYPVIKDRKSRTLIGSSMGGFVTASFAAKHKDIFSKFGIFSLASFIGSKGQFNKFLDKYGLAKDAKYFIYVGNKEGYSKIDDYEDRETSQNYIEESNKFVDYLLNNGIENYKLMIGDGENHSENSWKKYLPYCLDYLLK